MTLAARIEAAVLRAAAAATMRPFVVGICGAQGSGKSTVSGALCGRLVAQGLRTVVLGLDDLYLPRQAREALARTLHPLLRTRGVPGTHDVALGLHLLGAFAHAEPIAIPRFDKAADTRMDAAHWHRVTGPFDIVLFEGWMVGARPQPEAALTEPVNELERAEDADGTWRRWVNAQLAGDYQTLFARLKMLVLLAAPSFDIVFQWRSQQEAQLAAGRMDAPALHRFIAHYQRLTDHILAEMPPRADLVIQLDRNRQPIAPPSPP